MKKSKLCFDDSLRFTTKESNRRVNEKKKEAWQAKKNVINWLMKKEYKMDYLQLKRMTEAVADPGGRGAMPPVGGLKKFFSPVY